jgi:hypothetical protein
MDGCRVVLSFCRVDRGYLPSGFTSQKLTCQSQEVTWVSELSSGFLGSIETGARGLIGARHIVGVQ